MVAKNGFLLIELMIGLTTLIFFIVIITHYIIEVKNTQQKALVEIEALSLARNIVEKINAGKSYNQQEQEKFAVNIITHSPAAIYDSLSSLKPLVTGNVIVSSKNKNTKQNSITVMFYSPHKNKKDSNEK
jgi:type II secretory pathway pseudopilin PulG